jgi:hypothetical protein
MIIACDFHPCTGLESSSDALEDVEGPHVSLVDSLFDRFLVTVIYTPDLFFPCDKPIERTCDAEPIPAHASYLATRRVGRLMKKSGLHRLPSMSSKTQVDYVPCSPEIGVRLKCGVSSWFKFNIYSDTTQIVVRADLVSHSSAY